MSILVIILVGVATYFLYAYVIELVKFAKMAIRAKVLLKDVPGPPSLPIIGSAHLFKISSLGESPQYLLHILDSPYHSKL